MARQLEPSETQMLDRLRQALPFWSGLTRTVEGRVFVGQLDLRCHL